MEKQKPKVDTPDITAEEMEVIVAVIKEGEATDKKQVSWTKLGDLAIAQFPSGQQIHFDLTKLDSMVLKYYGAKQWLADQVASAKTMTDKINGMKESYDEAVKYGLMLSLTGKVGIIGKTRANATGAATAKAFETAVRTTSKVVSLEGLLMKKAIAGMPGGEEFTTEDEAKLQEFLTRVTEKN